jgi:Bifunctional DNA primase/polymerase, N-terminal.
MSSTKQTVSDNLEDVGLAADRFISVNDGEKKSVDHDTRYSRAENVPGTNYGIYADEDDQFFILDVDDHKDGEEKSSIALAALDGLPDTLEVKSPHVANEGPGGHRLFKLDGDQTPAELFKQRFGTKNPVPTWGEVVSKNKYCVGAGSQLDGCNKDWCENCETADGGQYLVQTDREVAVVDPEMVIEALNVDPDLYDKQTENTTFVDVDASDIQSATAGDTITETNGNQDGGQDREYDDLDRDQVESMLRQIPGDQHFDDWIRTGYAVFDWEPHQRRKRGIQKLVSR